MVLFKNILLYSLIFFAGYFIGDFDNEKEPKTIIIYKKETNTSHKVASKETVPKPNKKSKETASNKIKKQTDKPYTNYKLFTQYLSSSQYQKAFEIYQNQATNDDIKKYQSHFFTYLQNIISKKNKKSLLLVNRFLAIEYENPTALYFKSQILFQNNKPEESMVILLFLKNIYLEKSLEDKVNSTLDSYTSFYIKKLQNQNDIKKLISFFNLLIEENADEPKYLYFLAKLYYDINNFDEAKNLLEQILYDEIYKHKAEEMLLSINKKIKLSQNYSSKISLEKKGTHFYIKALLNDHKEVKLLLDTGASITLIDKTILNKLEHIVTKNNISLNTAGGKITAKQIELNSFSIDKIKTDNFQIISSSIKNSGFDGLLGMNYLKLFDFYIDQKNAVLYLNPKVD